MATFDEEHGNTTERMANLVMEYVSQFIARDYLEEYEAAGKDELAAYVPSEYDEEIYKKITGQVKKNLGYNFKFWRNISLTVVGAICAFCVAFTACVLLSAPIREEIASLFLSH